MNTPVSPTPARIQLSDLFETCAANLKLDDVTRAPFGPVRIPPTASVGGNAAAAAPMRPNPVVPGLHQPSEGVVI